MPWSTKPKPLTPEGLQPHAATLLEFWQYLETQSVHGDPVIRNIRCAWHLLTWLDREDISLATLDDALLRRFLYHKCQCPWPPYGRAKAYSKQPYNREYSIFWFVRFLEETGHVPTLGELEVNLGYLDEFLEQKSTEGFTRRAVTNYRNQCRHFVFWLHHSRIRLHDVNEDVLHRFAVHECICSRPGLVAACKFQGGRAYDTSFQVGIFIKYLIGCGVVPSTSPAMPPIQDGLDDFRVWLRTHRAIEEATVENYVREVSRLITGLGRDPRRYTPELIRDVLLERFRGLSPSSAGGVTGRLRMYLRFLVTANRCPATLLGAIPNVPMWRHGRLPRYISPADVERVIACCPSETPKEVRDRAIVLLLARLGLRGRDIVNLRLQDVDWRNASIRVRSKTRQESSLPLPQDVGDALLDYLLTARPRIDQETIFVSARAPHRPLFSRDIITIIARAALDRAEVQTHGTRGAYVFRHSAATNMLRAGASLDTVGALLRHRSRESTTIYAKVDIDMLREVAQPWIEGGAPC